MKFNLSKKDQEGLLYENGECKKVVDLFKLNLWTFIWGHGEREWSSYTDYTEVECGNAINVYQVSICKPSYRKEILFSATWWP